MNQKAMLYKIKISEMSKEFIVKANNQVDALIKVQKRLLPDEHNKYPNASELHGFNVMHFITIEAMHSEIID